MKKINFIITMLVIGFLLSGLSDIQDVLAQILALPNPTIFETNDKIISEGEKFKKSRIYETLASKDYVNQISSIFKINTDEFKNEFILIPYFDGQQTFQTISLQEKNSKFIWKGQAEKSSSYATIIINGENVVGNIHIEEKLYSIKPLGSGFHVLVEIDTSKFIDEPPSWGKIHSQPTVNWYHEFEIRKTLTPITLSRGQIDLLVLYTENVSSLLLDVDDEIDLALEETNDSHVNSDSDARYRVVHTQEVDYVAAGVHTDIDRLTDPADNYLDFAHDLRDEYGADIVLLITDDPTWCGEASEIGGDESTAFAVVDYDCSTGYYSFGHEIGHLHGARHIIENDPSDDPFEYGHGLCDPDAPNEWRTIMGYSCPAGTGGPRIQYWSNPDVFFSGDSLGTEEDHDNARVMDETFQYVCSFREPSCMWVVDWLQQVTLIERNYAFCFDGFSINGGLSQKCVNTFDPCNCGTQAPFCENMLCPDYGSLQELITLTQLQEFSPYKLIDLGVKPTSILPREGMVILDSDVRDNPIRIKYSSFEKIIERNPSWSIRLN